MTSMVMAAMIIGFFAGGNLVIVAKDIEHAGKAGNINIAGSIAGLIGVVGITVLALSGVFKLV